MGPLRKYHVTKNGHRTILKLNEQDVTLYPDAVPVDGDEPTQPAEGRAARAGRNRARQGDGTKTN